RFPRVLAVLRRRKPVPAAPSTQASSHTSEYLPARYLLPPTAARRALGDPRALSVANGNQRWRENRCASWRKGFKMKLHRCKAATVFLARTQAQQALQMHGRRIALMLIETVIGVASMHFFAVSVTGRLCQNGSGGNRRNLGVSSDDVLRGARQARRDLITIHESLLRGQVQALAGAPHRQHGRAQDVVAIDLVPIGAGNAPGQ